MPHCIIEHSASVSSSELIPLVFSGALASGLFSVDGSDIKVRAIEYDHYAVGTSSADFVHVVVKLLSGRTAQQKKKLSDVVIENLSTATLMNCSITVEVVDMDRDPYRKVIR